MSRRIDWRRRALADLAEIGRRDARMPARLRDAAVRYADKGIGDVLKLAGSSNTFHLRVGNWRILFTLESGGRIMAVLRVLNRRDAHR